MREAHPIEQAVGMDYYVSDAEGTGGRLRAPRPRTSASPNWRPSTCNRSTPTRAATNRLVLRATLRGWDTNDFAGRLSDGLGISRERVSWAGTKDKRAVTTQLFSVDGVEPADLPEIADADVEVVGRAGRPVLFGDLAGNDFEIAVRDVDRPESVAQVTDDLREFAGVATGATMTAGRRARKPPSPSRTTSASNGSAAGGRSPTRWVSLSSARTGRAPCWPTWGDPTSANPRRRRRPEPTLRRPATGRGHRPLSARARVRTVHVPSARRERRRDARRLPRGPRSRPDEPPDDVRQRGPVVRLQPDPLGTTRTRASLRPASRRRRRLLQRRRRSRGLALPDTDRLQRVDEGRIWTVERHCERGRAFVTAPLVGTETELADGEPGEIRAVGARGGWRRAGRLRPAGEFESTGTRRAIQVRTDLGVEPHEGTDAVRFSFALPKGSYATVVLREYLKRDPEHLG